MQKYPLFGKTPLFGIFQHKEDLFGYFWISIKISIFSKYPDFDQR